MKESSNYDIIIIGAGLAGLYAAVRCENAGYSVLLLEAAGRPGGRIKTDVFDGFILDHGFQVLINSYPKAQEVFEFDALHLQAFESGAMITDDLGSYSIGDPIRNRSLIIPMLTSRVGSLGDKMKLWQLTRELKALTPDQTFESPSITTMEYLKSRGFSDKLINNFFVPFFGGIFLERALHTPAGMFRYVFRNFSIGHACLPENGMEALPKQLLNRLQSTTVRCNSQVERVEQDGAVTIRNGELITAKKIIIACNPKPLLNQLDEAIVYRETTTMYFSGSDKLKKMKCTIGLDSRKNSPVNNYCRLDEVQPSYAPPGKSLWSVTLRDGISATAQEVANELANLISAESGDLTHIRSYQIQEALPIVTTPRNDLPAGQTQLTTNLFLAGDYLLNGSIDAALRSGYRASKAVIETLDHA